MNKLKTFIYYLGTNVLCNLGVALLVFSSNKIFDDISDEFFIPTKAAALGYIPFMFSAVVALQTTNNYDKTLKILWRWKLTLAFFISIYGLMQLITGIYFGFPLFDLSQQEIGIFTLPDHWLYCLPYGITSLIAGFQVKKGKIDMF